MQITTDGIRTQLFVGGNFVDAADGGVFATINPATGNVIAEVAEATAADVDQAVEAARAALAGPWGKMELRDRARIIRRVAQLLDERADALGELESLDGGKPIRETAPRVRATAAAFDFFADVAQKLRSDLIPSLSGYLNYTLRQPVGVVALIIPWNYPLPSCGHKIPPALAMGNTIILKPAEQAPLTPLALAEICNEAGVPEGVINVLPGYGPTAGRALVEHPGTDMVSFTGSTVVGRDIAARAGALLKPVTLELGGKSPNIVFPDADVEMAAQTALFSFCVNQGQICTAGSRLLVHEDLHDEFVATLAAMAERLRIGDPTDFETQLGAIITAEQLKRVEDYVALGLDSGGVVVTGGRRGLVEGFEKGYFYTPTVFVDVDSHTRVAQEEIFGPVLSVIPFRDEAHAIELANDVLYGLAAGVWTSDLARAHRMARAIDCGIVWVNTMHALAPGSPYGGWKQSGLGLEGGLEAAESFTRLKSVWVNVGASPPAFA